MSYFAQYEQPGDVGCDFFAHHTRDLSLAIATAVGEAITTHASVVKGRLADPPAPQPVGDLGES